MLLGVVLDRSGYFLGECTVAQPKILQLSNLDYQSIPLVSFPLSRWMLARDLIDAKIHHHERVIWELALGLVNQTQDREREGGSGCFCTSVSRSSDQFRKTSAVQCAASFAIVTRWFWDWIGLKPCQQLLSGRYRATIPTRRCLRKHAYVHISANQALRLGSDDGEPCSARCIKTVTWNTCRYTSRIWQVYKPHWSVPPCSRMRPTPVATRSCSGIKLEVFPTRHYTWVSHLPQWLLFLHFWEEGCVDG